jgi:hypothetical protein
MAKAKSGKVSEDKIVQEVVKKYGDQINLKETPYVLTEILRTYGKLFDDPDGGLPPGGTPPPTGPASRRVENAELLTEILKVGRQVKALQAKIGK